MDTGRMETAVDTHRIWTIPNMLSFLRIILAALFAVIYWNIRSEAGLYMSLGILAISGITDFADGKIARHFHQVSELGKVLDPIADKITQVIVAFCLCMDYPIMKLLLGVLVVKEVIQGLYGLYTIQRTGHNYSSMLCGKISTFYLYAMMILLLMVPTIPAALTTLLTLISTGLLVWSFISYLIAFRQIGKAARSNPKA